jgi:hypothetical protein
MQPFHPYTIRTKPSKDDDGSTPEPSPPVTDKRRPHMAIALNTPVLEVNGQLHFARPVSEDGDVSETDLPPPLVHCRHFALQYCRHSIHNPKFHPRELLGQYPVTQADPDWLDERDERLPQFAGHIHLLPANRFGEFLTLTFNEMLEESQTLEGRPPSGQSAQIWRVFCATTIFHAMGLRLLIEREHDGEWECVVSVYDPNTTNQQVKCRTPRPQDFADHPADYDFLCFLIHAEMDDDQRAEVMRYFPAIDTGRHLQLYELTDLEHEHEAPQSLSTDWCTNTRVALIYAECAEMGREIDVHLRTLLPDDGEQIDPESLQALPGVDKSLLSYAMQEPQARALLAWERLWMAQPLDVRISLLRGESRQGVHVLACAAELPEHALSGWCRMAARLPEAALRQVLDNTQHDDSPLICALHQTDPALITAVIALIDQATASAPLEAATLLRAHDSEGRSALEVAFCSGSEATLRVWARRVMKLPLPEARELMAGVQRNTEPLWARLLLALDRKALARLAECYEEQLPATAAANPHMALSLQTPLSEEIHVLAQEQRKAFEGCVSEIAEWLPEATLQQLDTMRWF